MAHNDEGEFELVIGNRQLLLVFGVLLVLLGVLFTMGYLIGKNNPSKEAITAANNRQVPIISGPGGSGSPIIVDPGKQIEEKAASRSATELYERATAKDAAKDASKEVGLPEVPKVPKEVEKKKEDPKKEEPKKEAKKETPPPEPKVSEPVKPKPMAAVASGSASPPAVGTYVQVVAVDLEGANSWVGTLRGKSFNAVVAPGPNEKLYRVLIGPIKDKEALAQTKIDLEKLGVKGAFVKKY